MASSAVPTEVITIYNSALEHSNRGELELAIDEYRKAIKIHPDFVEAYNNIGEIYSRMGDHKQAISSYREALNIEKHYRVLLNIGVEYYNNRDLASALKFFNESLSLRPDFLEGNYYTGLIYYEQENYENAADYLSVVIRQDRKHLKANYLLSHIYYQWKDYHRTLQHLDNIKDIAEDKTFINRYYGFCYYYLGDYKKAVTFLTGALESHPVYSKFAQYLKGLTYENKMKEIDDIEKEISILEAKRQSAKLEIKDATRLSMLYIFNDENDRAEKLLISLKQEMGIK